jgi:hypothetical protein
MTLIREWFAEWAQAYFVRHGYDPVNRVVNVLGSLLIVGALGIVAVHAFS